MPLLRDHAKWANLDVADKHRSKGTEDSPHRAFPDEVIAENFWMLEGRRDVVLRSSTSMRGVIVSDSAAVADTVGDVADEARVGWLARASAQSRHRSCEVRRVNSWGSC